MNNGWKISAEWETLDTGSQEERSCFAALGIQANDRWLTEGRDALANRLRQAPLLSAYHLAEWFAWNWWRLRWEPRASNPDWAFAHKMSNIGGGYIWPNITIFSDGERTALLAKATRERIETPFRYITDAAAILPSGKFEVVVDEFVGQVLERLDAQGVGPTNLSCLWSDVIAERGDPELSRIRKLEALLGKQPDDLGEDEVIEFLNSAERFGISAVEEIAADQGHSLASASVSASGLLAAAQRGFAVKPSEMVRLRRAPDSSNRPADIPAWRLGAEMAKALRDQEALGDAPLENVRLAEFLAAEKGIAEATKNTELGISILVHSNAEAHIALRSRWQSGRRFELARLLCDHLMHPDDRLSPATRANTYRQKVQRSFAAELLSPFFSVMNMLQGDYSQESLLDLAQHFNVSEMTIRTQLVNHGVLEREDLDPDAVLQVA
ncbi:ImmA/IrrE family metallo-endopeptidase [Azovibrio restrictus]|uniref:ImmA/IrrE family metallo-endopeptidase n=1 Tax=Azovibrio restrictus TaxID=146938 RepID=UPI0026EACF43|nr:hypothetical protein [Azovibrio restrictus]MDD3484083.1 hypothetical protein [Azovibrio restrictus]